MIFPLKPGFFRDFPVPYVCHNQMVSSKIKHGQLETPSFHVREIIHRGGLRLRQNYPYVWWFHGLDLYTGPTWVLDPRDVTWRPDRQILFKRNVRRTDKRANGPGCGIHGWTTKVMIFLKRGVLLYLQCSLEWKLIGGLWNIWQHLSTWCPYIICWE